MRRKKKQQAKRLKDIERKNKRNLNIIYYYTQEDLPLAKIAKLCNTNQGIVVSVVSKLRRKEKWPYIKERKNTMHK